MATGDHAEKSGASRARIIEAAGDQIRDKGILGLRVQDVARSAGVSVPLIYKYFTDRDGLLAEVLGQMYVNRVHRRLGMAEAIIGGRDGQGITVESIVASIILADDDMEKGERELVVQMLAASREIPALARALAAVQLEVHTRLTHFLAGVVERLGVAEAVPAAALSMLIQTASMGMVLNDLLGDDAVDNAEFRKLFHVLVGSVVGENVAQP